MALSLYSILQLVGIVHMPSCGPVICRPQEVVGMNAISGTTLTLHQEHMTERENDINIRIPLNNP